MTLRERKIVTFLLKHKEIIMLMLISLLALSIRIVLIEFRSYDYNFFLDPWYQQISEGGRIAALRKQVGNYGIPYQFIITLFTYLPGKNIFWYKGLSIFFDYILAIVGAYILNKIISNPSKNTFVITYSVILFVPTIIMDSGLWGQCDSIYVSFILLSLLSLLYEKDLLAFISLGIAFAFKLQTVFILPLYLLLYIKQRRFSILYFGVSLLAFYICSLPGIVMGRKWYEPFTIYFMQTSETHINMYYPNLSGIIYKVSQHNLPLYIMLKYFFILLTIGALLIGCYFIISYAGATLTGKDLLFYAVWISWTCVMFLPSMHDRYGYLTEVLLVILSIAVPKYWVNTFIALISSFIFYSHAMFGMSVNLTLFSDIAVINYCVFTLLVFRDSSKRHIKMREDINI
ncbi:MAG: glycosyltransferase 87 family protein [Limosilactobacillus pontis]|uniref:DUF2029 domain-containing protein n=1 Tax=Limosilactobacillus pontis TaxID=35787 RepID=A0A2J6NKU5_9LACO|nr:glycosyltransferase 87 family protein [Limosilactobacillus pontis]PMB81923.1 hypothetical protein CK797_08560 [Limosilactobacillus pontis]